MYVDVKNKVGNDTRVNTRQLSYTLHDKGTLFVNFGKHSVPQTSNVVQAGKLTTHLLADDNFLDLRLSGDGYILNLRNIHQVDAAPTASFVHFINGSTVHLSPATLPTLSAAMDALQDEDEDDDGPRPHGGDRWLSKRWQRIRYGYGQ